MTSEFHPEQFRNDDFLRQRREVVKGDLRTAAGRRRDLLIELAGLYDELLADA